MKYSLLFAFLLLGGIGFAQRSNIAYISTNELWNKMPDKIVADSILETEAEEYRSYLTAMVNELKQMEESYEKSRNNEHSGLLQEEKLKDIQLKQKRIEEYSKNAEKELSYRKDVLYKPIRDKMQLAIDKVAERNKYDYVLDSSFGNIVYRKNQTDDILPLVLKELGI